MKGANDFWMTPTPPFWYFLPSLAILISSNDLYFSQCTNDMTFSISADTDNHRYNPIFISADTDKKPIQIFLYRPIPIPITDITSFVIYAFFIMLNVYFLASKLGDAGGASTPTHFCPSRGFLLWISTFFWVKSPSCTSTIYLTLVLMSISVGLPIWHSVSADTDNRYR